MKKRIGYVSNSSVSSFCIMGVYIYVGKGGRIIDYDTKKPIFDIEEHKEKMISSIQDKVKQNNYRKHPDFNQDDLFVDTEEKWKEIFNDLSEEVGVFEGHGYALGIDIEFLGEDETRSQFRHRVFLELKKMGYIGDESLIDIVEDTDE